MSEVPEFVYYRNEDYARVIRRAPSFVVDVIVLFLALSATATLAQLLYVPPAIVKMPNSPEKRREVAKYMGPVQVQFMLGWLAFAVLYHIPLRRTRGGTIGYRVTGIRLVDAHGRPPDWWPLVKRFLVAVPFFFLLATTYWICFKNPKRQAFHDQIGGTWLIRKNAQPAGPAKPSYQTKLLGVWILTYLDLEPQDAAVPVPTPAGSSL